MKSKLYILLFAGIASYAGDANHAASNNELKWEWMYNDYVSLQRMYHAIY